MNGSAGYRGCGPALPRRYFPTTEYAFARGHRRSAAVVCALASLFLVPFTHAQGGDPVRGEKLVNALGCLECHTLHGEGGGEVKAPEFANIFGSPCELESGETLIIDEAYVRESIQNPDIKVVKGYPAGKMPPKFKFLPEEDLAGIVAFLKSLSAAEAADGAPAADGVPQTAGTATDLATPSAAETSASSSMVIGLFAGVAVCAVALGACPPSSRHSNVPSASRSTWSFPWPK